jgi:hypothetical protein
MNTKYFYSFLTVLILMFSGILEAHNLNKYSTTSKTNGLNHNSSQAKQVSTKTLQTNKPVATIDAFSQIEAESYTSMSGVQIAGDTGNKVGFIQNGDYIEFDDVDFGTGALSFDVSLGTDNQGGIIEIRLDALDGPLVGSVMGTGTGSFNTFKTFRTNLAPTVTGIHKLYLKFTDGLSEYLFDLDWFKFNTTPIVNPTIDAFSQIEAEDYTEMYGVQAEPCSEGGSNLGYIEYDDYIAFKDVDFGTGALSFEARAASTKATGGAIEIILDDAFLLATPKGVCNVLLTGGNQTYDTFKCNLTSSISGKHDLYLRFTGSTGFLLNLNWFKFNKGTLSVKENLLSENTVKVYLNPASNILNIDDAEQNSEKAIKVINTLGQIVFKTKSNSQNTQIDMGSLHISGLAIIEVISGNKVSTHKVICK